MWPFQKGFRLAAAPRIAVGAGALLLVAPLLASCASGSQPAKSSTKGKPLPVSASCSGASVYPSPGSRTASPSTQISFRNVTPAAIEADQVVVSGSRSGTHQGRWVADSDQRGASFYPDKPFSRGETVTVTVTAPVSVCGASGGKVSFSIARRAPTLPSAPAPKGTPTPKSVQPTVTYQSQPTVKVPKLSVSVPSALGGGYVFESPKGGNKAGGPEIVDGQGQVVWFDPLPLGESACDFKVQTYQGQPVLTWWQGYITSGHGDGYDVVMNSSYQIIATVRASNGYQADLHAFKISAAGNAWITVDNELGWDLKSVDGPSDGAVYEGVVQEVDIATGNVLFEWHSLDHVPLRLSAFSYAKGAPYDYFHVNALDPMNNGTVVISSRNTDAVYDVSRTDGRVLWELGGKDSSFAMAAGTRFALQHDAEMHGLHTISIFDDEDAGTHPQPARAIVLSLNYQNRTAWLVWSEQHGQLVVSSQGNVQLLANGDIFVGWGQGSATTEYGPGGKILFKAAYGSAIDSYRAYLFPWTGTPTTAPALAVSKSQTGLTVYASWNGSSQTQSWEVLGGASASQLQPLATAARSGFQTTIQLASQPAVVQVVARGSAGQPLATSAATPA
ncbi:MAG TPA: arylsulfotransferase family protein [Candidatus Nanopelagicaceae bacterium]|nr:arylsulfotransferase family protein [Candidatus Nanopelagicaceae bacterium]